MEPTFTRMMLARWAPWQATRKTALVHACVETGVPARPNWLHASHEDFLDAVVQAGEHTGVKVTGRQDIGHREGRHNRYQTVATWSLLAAGARPGAISWNVETGRVGGTLKGSAYTEFRAALEEAVEAAERNATIGRGHIHDQVAVALMEFMPAAPFVQVPHIGAGTWLLAADGPRLNAARRFMQLINAPVRELSELEGPTGGVLAVIDRSQERAEARFGARVGWVESARKSHARLKVAVSR